ncbi:MAG: hypothetical protein EXR51_02165, partial [Dehalococcoidia bacterium]|nr:hypothetical protein [Dehalococcoidia bacterium]
SEGVGYIQLDAPRYSYFVDPKWREHLRGMGEDPDRFFDAAIAADNEVLAGARRPEVALALHVCRGNNQSKWYAQGGYDAIAEQLFGGLQVDRFLLEYDTERAGTFEPLRFIPRGKAVVLGLVSSKDPALEPGGLLRRRIDEAARYVPLEDLALSPQCGQKQPRPVFRKYAPYLTRHRRVIRVFCPDAGTILMLANGTVKHHPQLVLTKHQPGVLGSKTEFPQRSLKQRLMGKMSLFLAIDLLFPSSRNGRMPAYRHRMSKVSEVCHQQTPRGEVFSHLRYVASLRVSEGVILASPHP